MPLSVKCRSHRPPETGATVLNTGVGRCHSAPLCCATAWPRGTPRPRGPDKDDVKGVIAYKNPACHARKPSTRPVHQRGWKATDDAQGGSRGRFEKLAVGRATALQSGAYMDIRHRHRLHRRPAADRKPKLVDGALLLDVRRSSARGHRFTSKGIRLLHVSWVASHRRGGKPHGAAVGHHSTRKAKSGYGRPKAKYH